MAPRKDILKSLASLASSVALLVEQQNILHAATEERIKAEKAATEATQKRTEEDNKAKEESDKLKASYAEVRNTAVKFGSELAKITEAGIKFASVIGTTATSGIELEVTNRVSLLKQLADFNANQSVTLAQLQSAQQSFTDTFISTREGFQLSSDGARQFAQNLKGGFNSEFQLTGQSLQALITAGVSTRGEFEQLRAASGRASLSGNQLANIVNKNSLSFLVFGNSFAKAAADADKLGISLSSVQAQQESYVTNLDGAIDTISQLNQIGATLDFGTLTRLQETGTPEDVLRYINAETQAINLNLSSVRSLTKGIANPEDLLKLRGKSATAADSIEAQMTERAKAETTLGKVATFLTRDFNILKDTVWGLGSAALYATAALFTLGRTAPGSFLSNIGKVISGLGPVRALKSIFGTASAAAPAAAAGGFASSIGGGLLGMGAGIGAGTFFGKSMGASTGSAVTGSTIGSILGGILGAAFIPVPGGFMIGSALGGMAGGAAAGLMKGDDVISSAGYGDRQLVTPTGTIALNNNDTVMAGTNLLSKGALSPESNARTEQLHNKLDTLIGTLNNATTTINVDGQTSTVPRMAVTGVYTRSEKR
jgi:hypothetical protein